MKIKQCPDRFTGKKKVMQVGLSGFVIAAFIVAAAFKTSGT